MKPVRAISILLAAAICGLALGWVFRRAAKPEPLIESISAKDRKARLVTESGQDRPLSAVEKLERGLPLSGPVERRLLWMQTVEQAAVADFPRLARAAAGNSSALRLVALRWMELDARNLIDAISRGTLAQTAAVGEILSLLYEEWPDAVKHALVAALTDGPPFGERERWRSIVTEKVIRADPELGLELLARWHVDNYLPTMDGVAKWAAKDPRHAAEFTSRLPPNTGVQGALAEIGKQWAKTDAPAALAFAAEKRGGAGLALAQAAMSVWAGANLDEAAGWLGSADPAMRNRLSPPLVEAWAKSDPAAALLWCEENLGGSTLNASVASALRGAVEKNPASAADLVLAMEPSRARAEGAAVVAEKLLPSWNNEDQKVSPESLAWLRKLDEASLSSVLERLHWIWAERDPASLAETLQERRSESIPDYIYHSVVRAFVRKDPLKAIEWAQSVPEGYRASAGAEAFGNWHRSQPELAREWLHALPPSDPRRAASFEGLLRDISFQPLGAEQLAALPAEDRAAAIPIIEKMAVAPDVRAKLIRAARGP